MGMLEGDLDVMSVPDVLIWLAMRTRTGLLSLRRGTVHKRVFLVEGAAVQSSSEDPRERLGQHLINYGYVAEEQLRLGFQTQQQTGVPLGRVLVLGGVLEEARLMRVLAFKTRECLLDAFDWEQGHFSFDPGKERDPELDASVPTPLADVHSEGLSRRTMWQEIRKVLPGAQVRLEVSPQVPGDVGPLDRKILEHAAAGCTLGEVALEVRALDFHVFARVYDLVQRGLVRALPVRAAPSAPWPASLSGPPSAVVPTPSDELVVQLRGRLEGGDLDDAFLLAQRILERDPNHAEALAALQQVEQAPRDAGRPVLEDLAVPRLAVSRMHLEEYLLTSKERYVLSRIDGRRTLEQIIQLSPIQETELRRIMDAFVQRGFVRV